MDGLVVPEPSCSSSNTRVETHVIEWCSQCKFLQQQSPTQLISMTLGDKVDPINKDGHQRESEHTETMIFPGIIAQCLQRAKDENIECR